MKSKTNAEPMQVQEQHTPEPWHYHTYATGPDEPDTEWVIVGPGSEDIAHGYIELDPAHAGNGKENARRIVAAINYVEGTDTETLERAVVQGHTLSESINGFIEEMRGHIGTAAESVAAAARSHRAMMEERDALLEALRRLVETQDALANARLRGESWTAEYREYLEARKAALHLIKEEAPEIETADEQR